MENTFIFLRNTSFHEKIILKILSNCLISLSKFLLQTYKFPDENMKGLSKYSSRQAVIIGEQWASEEMVLGETQPPAGAGVH